MRVPNPWPASAPLLTRKDRRALFHESQHAFELILASRATVDRCSLYGERFVQGRASGANHAGQNPGDGRWRHGGKRLRKLMGRMLEFFEGMELPYQPDAMCFGTRDLLCPQDHVERVIAANTASQARSATPCGQRTQIEFGQPDLCTLRRGQAKVACER